MNHDLGGLLKKKVNFTEGEIKYIIREILIGTQFIHQNHIIHRDFKSENIFFDNRGSVKIGDFGLSKNDKICNTNRKMVVSLWYRAPELLLGTNNYSNEIDIWALGCLFVEIICKGDILFKGSSELQVFQKIINICGEKILDEWPDSLRLAKIQSHKLQDNNNLFQDIIQKNGKGRLEKYLRNKIPSYGDELYDFLMSFLNINPLHRINANKALNHPYLTKSPHPSIFYMKFKTDNNSHYFTLRTIEKKEIQKNKKNKIIELEESNKKKMGISESDIKIENFLQKFEDIKKKPNYSIFANSYH